MTKSDWRKCEHCRQKFYVPVSIADDLCTKCRQRLDQAMTGQTTETTVASAVSGNLTRPWQMRLFQ